jgi:transketolase N-terminal domain/subunit
MSVQTMDDIRELAQQLRVDSIRCSTSAGSGHPTSSMSAADLMAVLLTRHLLARAEGSAAAGSPRRACGQVRDNDAMPRQRESD